MISCLLTCLCQVVEKGKELPVLKATLQISSNLSNVTHVQTLIITLYACLSAGYKISDLTYVAWVKSGESDGCILEPSLKDVC